MSVLTLPEQPLDWHAANWQQLARANAADRLPHALLLAGPAGLGKHEFANQLALSLLNLDTKSNSQEQMNARLLAHPDAQILEVEEGKHWISVEQVRQLLHQLFLTRSSAERKVLLIRGAERMNHAAANALLKGLEEPPAGCHFLLLSDRPASLMATIRSRCQLLSFTQPTQAVASQWLNEQGSEHSNADTALALALAGGKPFAALAWLHSSVLSQRNAFVDDLGLIANRRRAIPSVARAWLEHEPKILLEWLSSWALDIARARLLGSSSVTLANIDLAERIQKVASFVPAVPLMQFCRKTQQCLATLGPSSNTSLVLEDLLFDWQALLQSAKRA